MKAVISSGYADSSAIADHQGRGFAACLKKPYQLESLRSVLAALLD